MTAPTRPAPDLKEMQLSAHLYWVRHALDGTFLLDFLSESARQSVVQYLAETLHEAYRNYQTVTSTFILDRAVSEHPLAGLLSKDWTRKVTSQVLGVYTIMEKGEWP